MRKTVISIVIVNLFAAALIFTYAALSGRLSSISESPLPLSRHDSRKLYDNATQTDETTAYEKRQKYAVQTVFDPERAFDESDIQATLPFSREALKYTKNEMKRRKISAKLQYMETEGVPEDFELLWELMMLLRGMGTEIEDINVKLQEAGELWDGSEKKKK